MSFADNKTTELWQSFMPQRHAISHRIGIDLYSVEVYDSPAFFNNFDPHTEFEKWAAIEVSIHGAFPSSMETLIIPEGMYAAFTHHGPASEGPKTYQFIFATWLPGSAYLLDDRPHFALMGAKYKHNAAESEEEIWIPIKSKSSF